MSIKQIVALVACMMVLTLSACTNQEINGQNAPKNGQSNIPDETKGLRTIINTKVGDLFLSYANGKVILQGTLQRSTPCVNWQVDTVIMESYPEQVRFSIEDKSTAEMCIQVLGEPQDVYAEAAVSEEARITVLFEEEIVYEGQLG
jgi:hypothetical protein